MRLLIAVALAFAAMLVVAAPPASLPAPPGAASTTRPAAAADFVSSLSDEDLRRLRERLADPAPPPSAAKATMGGMASAMEDWTTRLRRGAEAALAAIPELPTTLVVTYDRYLAGKPPSHGSRAIALLMGAFVLGLAVEWVVRRALAPLRGRLERRGDGEGLAGEAARLVLRLGIDLAGLAAFFASVLAVFVVLHQGHTPTRYLVFLSLGAVVLVRLWAVVSRLLLSPAKPSLRLMPLGDAAARSAHRGLLLLAGWLAFTAVVAQLLIEFGAPRGTLALWQVGVIAVSLAIGLYVIWTVRRDVLAETAAGAEPSARRALVVDVVALLLGTLLLVMAGARLVETLGDDPAPSFAGAGTIALLLGLTLLDLACDRVLGALLARPAESSNETRSAVVRAFEPKLRRAIHIVVGVIGFVALARLWDIGFHAMATNSLGGQISGALLGIGITILVSWLLWELLRTAIDVRMTSEAKKATGTGSDVVATRLGTLLPLLRIMLQITVVVMATLSILAALGVNIVPLLAGAGVVGVAVGFGSQTLVRDIVTGAFFLLDDAFRVGEYIEVGQAKGTVEKIRLRALFLRHHRGSLFVLPYGEIKQLRNNSRDYMIMVMEFPLELGTDLQKVKKIMARVGQELADDDEYGSELLQPLKSQGVMSTVDNTLTVRAKFTAKPGSAPWVIRRIAYAKILKAFADEGIQFARRQVAVYVPPGGKREDVAGAAAAAQDAPR